jgi:hypothetical protein
MSGPDWNTPAHLDGLPYKNWKRRSGYTETGTLAQMVERWLRLAWHVQSGCSLGWGPDGEGRCGHYLGNGIGAFVLRVGLPPAMLAQRGRPPTPEEIERYFAKPVLRDGPQLTGPSHFNPGLSRVPK